jgi:hypothetical protein
MKFAAYIQATKDDFCLFEVCKRLLDEGLTDFFFSIPDEYWNGRITPNEDITQVEDVVNRLRSCGANVKTQIFQVQKHRRPGRSRIEVETFVRNESVHWIRGCGFEHIIIVDGDELWKKNYFYNMTKYIKEVQPPAIALGMIPTIGLPGYPIDGAQDLATVYIGPGVWFQECRKPTCESLNLVDVRGIIHFTATRRTMQEIIDKHRTSGHYDDPSYDFEGWIANTLPNAKPGMVNAHMYVPYQIWPRVRSWTKDEIDQIPVSIHPYLGLPNA